MKHLKHTLIIAAIILSTTSCTQQRQLTILRDIGTESDTLYQKYKPAYHLQPSDILYVRVITQDKEVNDLFNPMFSGGASNLQVGTMYLLGYEVKDSGYIEMPILKKIQVAGLTLDAAQDSITAVAFRYLKNPQIIVKLHSFEFAILGEVETPGMKSYGTYDLNILEAIALAGDITYNGNRQNIVLMRPSQNEYQIFRLDLTDKDIVSSEQFFIQPNDVIYVEPLKSTILSETTSDWLFFISAMGSVLSLVLLVLKL
ncbi:MAG: polysaccharide biosynthesis/export family protein [Bacteroidales bacterium]|nr:polysaccharide biosynthesis/export family protein [Saprospiraceae bacterium]MCF8381563.1 polysaccharide biosynthesis/export family protein [Bacteroidales bacterium]